MKNIGFNIVVNAKTSPAVRIPRFMSVPARGGKCAVKIVSTSGLRKINARFTSYFQLKSTGILLVVVSIDRS